MNKNIQQKLFNNSQFLQKKCFNQKPKKLALLLLLCVWKVSDKWLQAKLPIYQLNTRCQCNKLPFIVTGGEA
jgi:hypothetical protein